MTKKQKKLLHGIIASAITRAKAINLPKDYDAALIVVDALDKDSRINIHIKRD